MKIVLKYLLFFSLSILFLSPVKTTASEVESVSDEASLLTEEEITSIELRAEEFKVAYNIDTVILTRNQIPGTRKQYIEEYFDNAKGKMTDAVILLINMDSRSRGVEIQGYGECEFKLSNDRIETILDDILPYLSDGEYYDSMICFLDNINYFMNIEPTTDYQHTQKDNDNYVENYYENAQKNDIHSFGKKSLLNLLISLVIGSIVVFIFIHNSSGKITVSQNTYLNHTDSRILGRYDRYTHTTTTRRPKPKPSKTTSSGSSFGGGVSSGGHSHSGGGRSF